MDMGHPLMRNNRSAAIYKEPSTLGVRSGSFSYAIAANIWLWGLNVALLLMLVLVTITNLRKLHELGSCASPVLLGP